MNAALSPIIRAGERLHRGEGLSREGLTSERGPYIGERALHRREVFMKRMALCLAVYALWVSMSASGISAQGGGWTTLFDGASLKGWNVVGDANWEVAEKALQANKGTGFLVTPMTYTDFQFTADFWV